VFDKKMTYGTAASKWKRVWLSDEAAKSDPK